VAVGNNETDCANLYEKKAFAAAKTEPTFHSILKKKKNSKK